LIVTFLQRLPIPRGAWAVADQALFAGTNFIVQLVLARWLPVADYGGFAVAYTVLTLLQTGHQAVLTEPMLVFGAGRYREMWGGYRTAVLRLHVFVSLVIAGILGAIGFLGRAWIAPSISHSLVAMAFAAPFALLIPLLRRGFYVTKEEPLAALAGLGYLTLALAALALLARAQMLSAGSAMFVIGATAAVIALPLLRLAKPGTPAPAQRDVWQAHWKYGVWAGPGSMLRWVPDNIALWLLGHSSGLAPVGTFEAITNLILPVRQAFQALAMNVLPQASELEHRGDRPAVRRFVMGNLRSYLIGALAHAVFFVVAAPRLIGLVYGPRYSMTVGAMMLLAAVPIGVAAQVVLGAAVRAMERPDAIFRATAVGALLTLFPGYLFISLWGVTGACATLLFSGIATAAVTAREFNLLSAAPRAAAGRV
jgi:O-antigen/teichoic acid export membrane protein